MKYQIIKTENLKKIGGGTEHAEDAWNMKPLGIELPPSKINGAIFPDGKGNVIYSISAVAPLTEKIYASGGIFGCTRCHHPVSAGMINFNYKF